MIKTSNKKDSESVRKLDTDLVIFRGSGVTSDRHVKV